MARIRTIKPEFFTSEDVVSLSPLARLFYVSLWCEADREGRLTWRPNTLKMRYFPGDNCDINDMADELVNKGMLVIYEVDDKQYAEIPTFSTHQVINNRESPSVIPSRVDHASNTRQTRVKAEGKEGREGKGREDASDASPAAPQFRPLEELKVRGVDEQVAQDWLKVRKAKRAPLTQTALNDVIREADKAGLSLNRAVGICCRRSWTGFDASWLKDSDLTPATAGPAVKDYL
jgi:hypothetical protein